MPFPLEFPIILPDGETVLPSADHVTSTLERLAEYLKRQPNATSVISTFARHAQLVEAAFQEILTYKSIDNAFGEGLNIIGRLVGQPRGGLNDATYRLWLKARMLLNRCSGTPEEIYTLFALIAPVGHTLRVREDLPAAFTLLIEGVALTAEEAAALLVILRRARAAGVGGRLEWALSAPGALFRLDSGPGLDQGKMSGASL